MKCFILLATLVAAVAADASAEADPGYFSGYGAYGYPGYGGYGYASPLLGAGYAGHGYAAAGYAGHGYAAAPVYRTNYVAPIAPHLNVHAAAAPVAPAHYAAQAYAHAPEPIAPVAAPAPVLNAVPAVPTAAVAPAVPTGPVSSQYHSQDEFGNYEYSYNNINSAKHEAGNALTGVTGSYSYVDGFGAPQRVEYVADNLGFRATGTNFPTTAATLGLHRKRRSFAAAPYAAVPAIAPTVSAPAAREAILTRIQLNPGHAVAYRVF